MPGKHFQLMALGRDQRPVGADVGLSLGGAADRGKRNVASTIKNNVGYDSVSAPTSAAIA
jgi:hypothetical protein